MNEADITKSLKGMLERRGFFLKKLRDGSTQGIPDSFLAKSHKGLFVEIKVVELKGNTVPDKYTQWSKLKPNGKMNQITSLCEFNRNFLARYIICYRVQDMNYFCLVIPERLLAGMQDNYPVEIQPVSFDSFLIRLENLLQI